MIGHGANTPSPWKERADVFEHSYAEVLAFLKHQDEKIGRVLTALAFLTAAGVALFVFSPRTLLHPLVFTKPSLDVADFFFAVFMVSLLFALLTILAAVDPTTQTPRFLAQIEQGQSIIFYRAIYTAGPDWLAPDADVEYLNERLARSFYIDAKELARRAEHKVSRFADSRAFVHVSIVALALLGIARIDGFDIHWRSWIIALVLAFVGFLPLWDIAMARHYGFAGMHSASGAPRDKSWLAWLALFLAPAIASAALLIFGGFESSPNLQFGFVTYALVAILMSRFFLRYLKSKCELAFGSVILTLAGFAPLVLFWFG